MRSKTSGLRNLSNALRIIWCELQASLRLIWVSAKHVSAQAWQSGPKYDQQHRNYLKQLGSGCIELVVPFRVDHSANRVDTQRHAVEASCDVDEPVHLGCVQFDGV